MVIEYVPAGQRAHVFGAMAPSEALYLPATQGVHKEALEADHVPTGHGMGLIEERGQ